MGGGRKRKVPAATTKVTLRSSKRSLLSSFRDNPEESEESKTLSDSLQNDAGQKTPPLADGHSIVKVNSLISLDLYFIV